MSQNWKKSSRCAASGCPEWSDQGDFFVIRDSEGREVKYIAVGVDPETPGGLVTARTEPKPALLFPDSDLPPFLAALARGELSGHTPQSESNGPALAPGLLVQGMGHFAIIGDSVAAEAPDAVIQVSAGRIQAAEALARALSAQGTLEPLTPA